MYLANELDAAQGQSFKQGTDALNLNFPFSLTGCHY